MGSWDYLELTSTIAVTFVQATIVQATFVLATFVLATFVLATFVHIRNIVQLGPRPKPKP